MLRERIHEGGPVLRQHIKVALARLDETEKAGAVHPLAAGEYRVEVFKTVYYEIEGL